MRVIAFHTGGRYREEADRLERSLRRSGVEQYTIEEHSLPYPAPTWDHAVSFKPVFIKCMREKYSGPLLSVDVDAVFHADPSEYVDALDCDFAAHWFQGPSGGYDRTRNDNHFLSGTMVWGDTLKARELIDAWLRCNEALQDQGIWKGGGQANLRSVLESGVVESLGIRKLPGRYCYVFDKPWAYPPGEPRIIEHLIASRENRGRSRGKVNPARRQRIQEIVQHWNRETP